MPDVCLKSGFIVDGTGNAGFYGDVLLEGERIKYVSRNNLEVNCPIIDCTGMVIAPGFIDAHSHQDWFIGSDHELEYTEPFIRQGITTYVAGNCGFGVAGISKGSPYKKEIRNGLFKAGIDGEDLQWDTYPEYFGYLKKRGIRQNIAMMAGHGTSMYSLVGAAPSESGLSENLNKALGLLEDAMDAGCKGVSLGLAYRPGSFASDKEIRAVVDLVNKKGKLITLHRKVETAVSGCYNTYEEPHNIRWLREFLDNFKDTDLRLQISHLLFVGRTSWPTYEAYLEMLQKYMDMGMDIWFDMYSYTQGGTEIAILLPPNFPKLVPQVYTDKALIKEVSEAMDIASSAVGISDSDLQLCNPVVPELQQYKGMYMDEMAKARGIDVKENYIDIYKRTNGAATMYLHVEQSEEHVSKLMCHERALYMTDAWIEPGCLQNPCAFGSFPKFLRMARESKNLSLEQVITRMTGRTAARFGLHERGVIKEGNFADLVIFNPQTVKETATDRSPVSYPIGIEHVFINGSHVLSGSNLDTSIRAGMLV